LCLITLSETHTLTHTHTHGTTPLEQGSDLRRDLYLTTHVHARGNLVLM